MSKLVTIARPYAKAAFDFSRDKGEIAHWQKMLIFAAAISCHPQMRRGRLINLSSEMQANLFISICANRLDTAGKNFIRIMAENRRLFLLPTVLALFNQYSAEHDSVIEVNVVSVTKLTNSQKNKIVKVIEKRLSKRANIINNIDVSIIAGFIIYIGNTVIDNSIKGRLERLTSAL